MTIQNSLCYYGSMKIKKHLSYGLIFLVALSIFIEARADQNVACRANQNDIYDSRVPPAGVYSTQQKNGSSNTEYTTGEKKPYIVDNNCSEMTTPIQPNIWVKPPQ